ncbi:probable E3 ubiquitin-protein ligase HERC3 isoform X3 [Gadus morhua]|uniref:probable E3 ubiquitin-protein ligase HERC3 isoform X3 n=1 Tax=Gadus morhua TaxID=8049 RepID=UPI0011B60A88|nr:probable E3 ubiquitin-protein ligase HERC3 isoform X3 [Gadus morhua]
MFSWGEIHLAKPNDLAENRESENGIQFVPTTKPIITSFSANNSTVTFTKSDGRAYFLRRQRNHDGNGRFGKTKSIKCKHVVASSSGDSGLLLLSRDGSVVFVDLSAPAIPRSLQNCIKKRIIQVACGDQHSIVLTEDGQALSWGSNTRGQLGLTLPGTSVVPSPTPVAALSGVPLVQVTAGGAHTLALSVSGTVFGWGQNDAGQLGLGDMTDRSTPVTVECLNLKKTVSVSCGERHTAVLTKGGLVFTFGSGGCGQLGHNSLLNELTPRVVAELWGAAVTQVSCGSNHTMALVGPTKKIYSFGRGEEGQLGNRLTTDCLVPLPVLLPHDDQKNVERIFAGGNQSLALCSLSQEPEKDLPGIITALDMDTIDFWLSNCRDAKSWRKIRKRIKDIFSSTSSLNASFLDRSADKHYQTSPRCSGLDLVLVKTAFAKLATNTEVLHEVETVVRDCLLPSLTGQPVGLEGLRVYYLLVGLLKVLPRDNFGEMLSVRVADAYLSLHQDRLEVLVRLLSWTPRFFRSAVKTFCKASRKLLSSLDVDYREQADFFMKTAGVLQRLHSASSSGSWRLTESVFHVTTVTNTIEMFEQLFLSCKSIHQYNPWFPHELNDEEQRTLIKRDYYLSILLPLVKFPCILPIECKMKLWKYHLNIASSVPLLLQLQPGYIEFTINRATVQQDTFQSLRTSSHDPKLKLAVKFNEEYDMHLGGVVMEFFHLLAKELQKAEPQILKKNDDGVAWFSKNVAQLTDEFFLLGTLCGMALYNQCLMNIPFPLALFKKLLGLKPTLDDLMELSPTVAQSFKDLLDYEEETIEVLQLDFGGGAEDLDLLPNGEFIQVTQDNRQKYVDLQVDMVFSRSVEHQFREFERGFSRGCPSPEWRMFLPDQLMTLLKGEEVHWDDLRQNAKYQGCTSNDEVIKNFWIVFAEFSVEQKKDFLIFISGTDRNPKLRCSTIMIMINLLCYQEPELYYPEAVTCYWTLNLPNYSNIQTLRQKLLHAVECCDTFG